MTRQLAATFGLVLLLALPAAAQQAEDEHVAQGNYLFKAGYYLKASEHYRLALLEDPSSAEKKLLFGHSLFAIGNYSYASYALRRGVADLDPAEGFEPDVAGLFPSRRAFTQALRDLKRYVTYSPRDPAGLTVLGYVLYAVPGEERRCRDMFLYLQRIDGDDPFAAFFLRQMRQRARFPREPVELAEPDEGELRGENPTPPTPQPPVEVPAQVPPPQPIEDAPPAPVAPPRREPPPVSKVVPAPKQQGERVGEAEWPKPVPALSD